MSQKTLRVSVGKMETRIQWNAERETILSTRNSIKGKNASKNKGRVKMQVGLANTVLQNAFPINLNGFS